MIPVLVFLCSLLFILYGLVSTIKPNKYPPGPVWVPFIGSTVTLQKLVKKYGSEFGAYIELSKQYSTNILGLKTSSELTVIVFGEKNVRQVFNSQEFDARPHNYFAQLRCLGKKNMGITFANGDIWKEHRRFAAKTLKHNGYGKTLMENEIQNELNHILCHIGNNINKPINVIELLSQSVMNFIWSKVAGERIPEEKLNHLLKLFRLRTEAFSIAGGFLNQIPWSRYIMPELSGYSLITKLNQDISELIEATLSKHKNNEITKNDFINLFLEKIYANTPTYTEEQLKIVCLDFMIAASQTTGNLLSFAILKLLRNQEIQETILKEIDSELGDDIPCWEDSKRHPAFIQEVHRYYPIVPFAGPRSAQKDTIVDGCLIPKGTTVLISLGDIYFDPELWEDPNAFKPERFIDESGKLKNSEHMYPFGLGRRRCPGESLAKSFIFIILVGILQKYRIQCSNGTMPCGKPVIGIFSAPQPYTATFYSKKIKNDF